MLVFSFNQSKPKAFVPLAWAGAVLAGMAAETLVTMGVKAVSKAALKKQADDYAAMALKDGKFDFMGTNPYRNKDGSISLSPTANDRAKMAGLISGALVGSFVGDGVTPDCVSPDAKGYPVIGQGAPYFYAERYIHPSYGDIIGVFRSSGELMNHLQLSPGNTYYNSRDKPFTLKTTLVSDPIPEQGILVPLYRVELLTESNYPALRNDYYLKTYEYKNDVLFDSLDERLISCNGLYVPSSVQRVYPAPMDMSSDYKMPNDHLLVNKPITIKNVMPPSQQEGEITWNEIEDYYNTNGGDFNGIVDSTIDNYFEKGLIAENLYTIGEINNYYTDTGLLPVKDFNPTKDDSNLPVPDPDEELPVPNPDAGELVPVEPIDRSLLQIAKESYQYLADTVKSSVDGLTAVTAGATGVITFLGTTMGWLPNEWIVMFSAAFGLGLFAFFFRR